MIWSYQILQLKKMWRVRTSQILWGVYWTTFRFINTIIKKFERNKL